MGIEHDKRGEFHEEPLGLTAANLARIEEFIDEHGDVAAAVDRKLREALASAERLEESESGQSGVAAESEPDLSNIRGPKPNSGDARQRASAVLTRAQLDEVLASALRTRELSLVGYLAVTEDVTERRLRKCLRSACEVDDPESTLSEANRRTVRGQLARLMLTDDPGLLPAVEEYLDLRRYNEIIHSTIGRPDRVGKIGGKAVGLVLASTIVENTPGVDKQFLPFAVPKSYFLTTDVFSETLRLSHLSSDYSGRKHQPAEELRKMYPATQETFQQLQFSEYTLRKLGKFLESVGNWPIIVRSSSLLEDSTGASFSGKYSSISFCLLYTSPSPRDPL